jgi:RimJ/RimL family protein N-acetyltransferase
LNGGCLRDLEVRRLTEADAVAVSTLLTADPDDYRRHFHPFPTDPESVRTALAAAVEDVYWGIWSEGLQAVVMLRGLDAGFTAPAFGVYVARASSGAGIARLAIALAEAWCRLNARREIMLTVHADNAAARRLYETTGYQFAGELSEAGHRIYRKKLDGGP